MKTKRSPGQRTVSQAVVAAAIVAVTAVGWLAADAIRHAWGPAAAWLAVPAVLLIAALLRAAARKGRARG